MKYIAALLLLVSFSANAEAPGLLQKIQGLTAEANSLSTEAPKLSGDIADAKQNQTNEVKEGMVYKADQKQKLDWVAQAEAQQLRDVYHPRIDPLNAETNQYTAQCKRTFNRDTEMAAYQRCMNWKANLDPRLEAFNTWWANYQVEWNHQNVDPINAVIVKQNARTAQLLEQWKANQARIDTAISRLKYIHSRIGEIHGIVNGFCHSEDLTAEAMKWCTNVDWDGASRNLPALPPEGYGQGGITPNN